MSSQLAVASILPSDDHATLETFSLWPAKVNNSRPVLTSHLGRVVGITCSDLASIGRPGNTQDITILISKVRNSGPVLASHSLTMLSEWLLGEDSDHI